MLCLSISALFQGGIPYIQYTVKESFMAMPLFFGKLKQTNINLFAAVITSSIILVSACSSDRQDTRKVQKANKEVVEDIKKVTENEKKPLTVEELAEKTGRSENELRSALESSNETPTMTRVDSASISIPKDFFSSKLSVALSIQSTSDSASSRFAPHIYVEAVESDTKIDLMADESHSQLSDLIEKNLFLSFSKSVGPSVNQDSIEVNLDNKSLQTLTGSSSEPWIRSLSFKNNGQYSYITMEYSVSSSLMGTNLATTNFIASIFPRQTDDRKFDKAAQWKVMSFLASSFVDNPQDFGKGYQAMPITHSPKAPVKWYLYTSGKKYLETKNGKDLYAAIQQGVDSWNIYGRNKKIVEFSGFLPEGVKVGEPGYSVVELERNKVAGTAYANFSNDPVTGLQTNSYVYISTSWTGFADRDVSSLIVEENNTVSKLDNKVWEKVKFVDSSKMNYDNHDNINRDIARAVSSFSNNDSINIAYNGIKAVMMHEIGHTLGMRHNFQASSLPLDTSFLTSVMDYSRFIFEIPLFKDGILNRTLDYDQAYIDVFYNELGFDLIADLEQCTDQDLPTYSTILGVDPFCKQYDMFESVDVGIGFQLSKLSTRPTLSGMQVKSFKDQMITSISSNLKDTTTGDSEDPNSETPNMSDIITTSTSDAIFKVFALQSASYVDVLRGKTHLLQRWASYETMIEKSSTTNFLKWEFSDEALLATYLTTNNGFSPSTREANIAKAGLSKFEGPSAYYAFEVSEKQNLLSLVKESLAVSAGNFETAKSLPSVSELSEKACSNAVLEATDLSFDACLEASLAGAKLGLSRLGLTLVQTIGSNISSDALSDASVDETYSNEGQISSETAETILTTLNSEIDIVKVISDENIENRLDKLKTYFALYTAILSRESKLNDESLKTMSEETIELLKATIIERDAVLAELRKGPSNELTKLAIIEKDMIRSFITELTFVSF